MAGSAEVGSARVKLAIDAGEFNTGAKNAGNIIANLESQVMNFATSWQGAMTAAVASSVAFMFSAKENFAKARDEILELGKTSQKIGLTVEALSAFQYAAKRSGVDSDSFANSIKKLSVNLQDTLKGGSSEATTALKNMGIQVTDTHGKLKGTTEILLSIAEKFATYGDSANKTAIAVALFGRAGTDMIPMLNKGQDGIEELTKRAADFGLTVDSNTVKAVKSMTAGTKEMHDKVDAFNIKLVRDLAPALAEADKELLKLSERFLYSGTTAKIAQGAVELYADSLKLINSVVGPALDALARIGEAMGGTAEDKAKRQADYDKFMAEIRARAVSLSELDTALENSADIAAKAWAPTLVKAVDNVKDKLNAPSLARSELSKTIETLTKQVAALNAMSSVKSSLAIDATVKESLEEYTKKLAVTKALAASMAGQPKLNTNEGAAIALEQYNKVLAEGKQLTEEYLTPLEKIEKAQGRINDAYRIGAINATTLARAQEANSVYSQKNMTALADVTANALDKIFGQTKAVAIATALINTYKGVTTALAEYPPPVSFAMAALQMAAGMAQVMNIRSQSSQGGAAGSSALPSAATAAQAATPAVGAEGGNRQSLFVEGITPGQLFSGDTVRAFAQKLLDFQKDGGKVVLA
jgi:hypothetical protein